MTCGRAKLQTVFEKEEIQQKITQSRAELQTVFEKDQRDTRGNGNATTHSEKYAKPIRFHGRLKLLLSKLYANILVNHVAHSLQQKLSDKFIDKVP